MALTKHELHKAQWMKKYTGREILGPWEYSKNLNFHGDDEGPGLVYDNDMHIHIYDSCYALCVENEEWLSEDLCYLEEILAEFRIDCGYEPYIERENYEKAEITKDKIVDDVRTFVLRFVENLSHEDLAHLGSFNVGEYLRDCLIENIEDSE